MDDQDIPTTVNSDGYWCDACRAYGEDSPATEILRFEGEDEFLCSPCFERRCERFMWRTRRPQAANE